MLENVYLKKRTEKNRRSVGGSASKPPLASGGCGLRPQTPKLLVVALVTYFYDLKITTYYFG